jgi:hypothetical protein
MTSSSCRVAFSLSNVVSLVEELRRVLDKYIVGPGQDVPTLEGGLLF